LLESRARDTAQACKSVVQLTLHALVVLALWSEEPPPDVPVRRGGARQAEGYEAHHRVDVRRDQMREVGACGAPEVSLEVIAAFEHTIHACVRETATVSSQHKGWWLAHSKVKSPPQAAFSVPVTHGPQRPGGTLPSAVAEPKRYCEPYHQPSSSRRFPSDTVATCVSRGQLNVLKDTYDHSCY
jgi:hypothetical protein